MKKLNQSGAVSMLSVIVFSIIITVVTLAYMASVTLQQRNALNYDLSSRAYYSAESGVQDSVRALNKSNLPLSEDGKKNNCTPLYDGITMPLPSDNQPKQLGKSEYNLAYTCQLVDATPQNLMLSIPTEGGKILKLNTTSGVDKIKIEWSRKDATTLYPRGTSPLFPPLDKWWAGGIESQPIHALLRVNLISHPTGAFSRDNIKQRVVFANPSSSVGTLNLSTTSEQQALFTNSACQTSSTTTNDYGCSLTVSDLGDYNPSSSDRAVYLKLNSIYRSTDVRIQLLDSNGNPVNVANTMASFDVTGRSGDTVFRRVKQAVPLGNAVKDIVAPDAALTAAEGICKNFSVGTHVSQYSPGCNPLTD